MEKMIKKAQSQGWEVRAFEFIDKDNCKVLVKREDAPFQDRPYSTHYYNTTRGLFYTGTYDMTYAQAKEHYDNIR